MTQYALTHSRWDNVYANDLGRGSKLFVECMQGEHYINRLDPHASPCSPEMLKFFSKEDFFAIKDKPYTDIEGWQNYQLCVFSFGNGFDSYRFGEDNIALHEAYWYAGMDKDVKEFEKMTGVDLSATKEVPDLFDRWNRIKSEVEKKADPNKIKHLNNRLQSCQSRLNNIYEIFEEYKKKSKTGVGKIFDTKPVLPSFQLTNLDYRDVKVKPNSVIYADPPYINSNYGETYVIKKGGFDHEAFYDWCEQQTEPLFISEYWMPEDRFVCISEHKQIGSTGWAEGCRNKVEKVYATKKQIADGTIKV